MVACRYHKNSYPEISGHTIDSVSGRTDRTDGTQRTAALGARFYVQGLLLDGERGNRLSRWPIDGRGRCAGAAPVRGQSPWAVEEVQRRLAEKVVDLLSEPEVWIVDETSFPKAGEHSVGVARQYCGTLGKSGQLPGGGQPALEQRRSQLPAELASVPAARMDRGPRAGSASQIAGGDHLSEQDGTGAGR